MMLMVMVMLYVARFVALILDLHFLVFFYDFLECSCGLTFLD